MSKRNFKRYIKSRKKARCVRRRMFVIAIISLMISFGVVLGTIPKTDTMVYGKVICNGTKILLNDNTVVSYDADDYNDDTEVVVIKDGKNIKVVNKYYFVQKGDTVWDIAESICTNNINKTHFIHEFYKINNITNGIINANDSYVIPVM